MNHQKIMIKICGLKTEEDITYVNETDIDFAGFVLFFEKSKRNNTLDNVQKLLKNIKPSIKKVAVVVSPKIEQIQQIEAMGFDYIQIHGELSGELLQDIHLPVLKAFNVKDMEQLSFYEKFPQIKGFVYDALEPGSGKTFDWNSAKKFLRKEKMFFLAGGLNADNVAQAVETLHPDAVDVSSGVEYTGRIGKDPIKITQFVDTVHTLSNQ